MQVPSQWRRMYAGMIVALATFTFWGSTTAATIWTATRREPFHLHLHLQTFDLQKKKKQMCWASHVFHLQPDSSQQDFCTVFLEMEQRDFSEGVLQYGDVRYKIYRQNCVEPSSLSYSCASVYAHNKLKKGETNFITYWNLQDLSTTIAVSFKLHRHCKRIHMIQPQNQQ